MTNYMVDRKIYLLVQILRTLLLQNLGKEKDLWKFLKFVWRHKIER